MEKKKLLILFQVNYKMKINQRRDVCISWDSLSHLSVIMAIEEKFNFSTSEIAKALSVEKIYSIIKAKKNN